MGIIISELGLIGFVETESRCFLRGRRNSTGGERSFSTLCFALALHEMTQAPFRVMDEFDVFMDALSRKISLDTLVDFALAQDSKWIFIMPHDIRLSVHMWRNCYIMTISETDHNVNFFKSCRNSCNSQGLPREEIS
ncbi:structural maintenance of chromosomes protein 6B-like isoform X2 [Benincasa hispida]|uniref:structural maintenance of chromosomes protein 6B-like isoform X2 n=1 Tax=Benincasa hispida TaxID=102211 RepID=UPI0018FFA484|nr:structural maintenance of chromosomes protein 6B-like isoform X2 [Benincasa hispida]